MTIHVEEIYTFDQDTKSIGVRHPSRLTLNSFTEDERQHSVVFMSPQDYLATILVFL